MKLSHLINIMSRQGSLSFMYSCVLIGGVAMTSCTDNFEKWNTNPNEATNKDMQHDNLNTGAYFSQMQRGVFIVGKDKGGEYQITQALEGDIFASYLATITKWDYTTYHNDHYALYQGWYNAPFNDAYTNIMQPWKSIADVTSASSPAHAMATIVKVMGMHRITDMYGPIPYSKFGTDVQVAYDRQQDVYTAFFSELDQAIDVLTQYTSGSSQPYLADYDNIYQGNVEKWVRFANSLRLRLAIRISNVDGVLARTEAEKSINHPIGLMRQKDDDAILHQSTSLTYRNPLWEISESWDDEHMSATMECYLNGYKDPRMSAYFQPATATGIYKGARNGMKSPNKESYRTVTSRMNFTQTSDVIWMRAAESYFLLAEAKMRWNIGSMSPKECYEAGVKTSFASAGVSGADTYLNSTALPLAAYTDPVSKSATSVQSMLTMLTPKWDDAASDDVNLQRIMLQKWIALYPDGQEAWSEMRRTGYPGWVRIASYSYQTEVKNNEMISRLKFPSTEYSNNTANTEDAVKMLGGDDKAGTRLWWDVRR